jgi:hypothetical protein
MLLLDVSCRLASLKIRVQRLGCNDADVVSSARLQEVKDADVNVFSLKQIEVSADFMNNSGWLA